MIVAFPDDIFSNSEIRPNGFIINSDYITKFIWLFQIV